MASELSIEAVRDFIALNDGKVKNQILVTHFRTFLNDSKKKADARQKFKDCVNTVAIVKTENGEKYVQLKKKFRTAAPITASHLPLEELPPQSVSSRGSPSHNLVSSFDAPIVPEDEMLYAQEPPVSHHDSRFSLASDDAESDGVLSYGSPEVTPIQVDPTVTTPDHQEKRDLSCVREDSAPLRQHSASQMDPSGLFRVPCPPQDRRSGSDAPKRVSHSGSTNSVEQTRLNFQNNGEDTSSIMQSEASIDSNKENEYDDDRSGSTFAMDPAEKKWMILSAKGDMVELRKMLNKDPNLAEKKDFIFGYNALHWGAKKGNEDLVRMFAEMGVDVNSMSNGGYTPMHIAAMHGHEKVVQMLLEEFDADPHIRNYSGKQARDYLKVASISLPMQKLLFGNDGTGFVRDFAAGLRPRLDSVRKSKRLGNAISGGVGVLGALVRGKATSNEDVSSIASSSPSVGRKGSFSKGKKKKSRKWSKDERPSISLISASDDMDSGFGSRRSSNVQEGTRRGNSSSPVVSGGHGNRGAHRGSLHSESQMQM